MNGAAAIALLAFMGANAGKEDPLVEVSIELFKFALMCFGGGASLCALTFLFAFIAQLFFAGINSSETHVWPANLFRLLAMICLVSAIVMFGVGVYVAAEALSIPRLRPTVLRSHPYQPQRDKMETLLLAFGAAGNLAAIILQPCCWISPPQPPWRND